MIHFVIGTKAQFIKMAPLMHLLQENGTPYHLLDLSQHGSITGKILEDFDLRPTITHLGESKSITTYTQAVAWLAHGFGQLLRGRSNLRRRLFLDRGGIALIHGDTLSTLLGLYLAKVAGLKIGMVEAGLTSGHLFDPFPEEWVRRHVGKRVDYLFPPDSACAQWLHRRRYKGQIINTGYNTGKDSLALIRRLHHGSVKPRHAGEAYGIVTLHRLETLSSATRLRRSIEHIMHLATVLGPMRFYMHPPTERALQRIGMTEKLRSAKNIQIYGLAPYPEFALALSRSRFILTDGGSIQEEAFYLNKPCLILRNRTERGEGIGKNALICTWNAERDAAHLRDAEAHVPVDPNLEFSASQTIVDSIKAFCGG